MVSKIDTEIFLPLTFTTYKRNKINLLKTQIKTMSTLERIKRFNELSKIKTQQRKLLKKTITEIKEHYSKLQKSLPSALELGLPDLLPSGKKYNSPLKQTSSSFHSTSRIDEELNKIQEKLKSLNI